MHHGEHTTVALCDSTRTFNLLDEELSNFVGVDVTWLVEADAGPSSRDGGKTGETNCQS